MSSSFLNSVKPEGHISSSNSWFRLSSTQCPYLSIRSASVTIADFRFFYLAVLSYRCYHRHQFLFFRSSPFTLLSPPFFVVLFHPAFCCWLRILTVYSSPPSILYSQRPRPSCCQILQSLSSLKLQSLLLNSSKNSRYFFALIAWISLCVHRCLWFFVPNVTFPHYQFDVNTLQTVVFCQFWKVITCVK